LAGLIESAMYERSEGRIELLFWKKEPAICSNSFVPTCSRTVA
jgi:hypothetical protein